MYKFTQNVFGEFNLKNLEYIFRHNKSGSPLKILEIGALEGMSTVWFLENVPDCTVTTIDSWKGGKEHVTDDFRKIKENFEQNVSNFRERLEVIESDSFDALISLLKMNRKFNFAYIDGSHTAIDVNLDLILSFKLLDVGSILYCDDYYWGFVDKSAFDSPKLGIDSFVNVYGNKLLPVQSIYNNSAAFVKIEN